MTGASIGDRLPAMNIVVMGAGAVGCYFGGLLAHAGHDVTFVGRQSHVDAINAQGLRMEAPAFTGSARARATSDPSTLGPAELVLVSVKSADTEAAGRSLGGALSSRTQIVSLQNGVDNAERLALALGRAVLPAAVYVGVEMAGLGHVRHHGRGDLIIGQSAGSPALAAKLAEARIPTLVRADILEVLWVKLLVNCAWNALSAIGGIAYAPLHRIDGVQELLSTVIGECRAVARGCGIALPEDVASQVLDLSTKMPRQMSSTAQDLKRGKPSEIDFLNGYIVRRGVELGIPTPANLALLTAIKVMEAGRAPA